MIRKLLCKSLLKLFFPVNKIKVTYLPGAVELSMPRDGDIGIDLYSKEYFKIPPGESLLVATGVMLQLPRGLALVLKDRSSVSKKLHVLAGVIDSSYRGEILVRLYNHTSGEIAYPAKTKLAQGILTLDLNWFFSLLTVSELEDSVRGTKGFGSTGA